ncbi:unnamed protein product [Rotaria socialis]
MENWVNITNITSNAHSPHIYQVVLGCTTFVLTLPFVVFHIHRYPLGSTGAVLVGALLMVICTVIDSSRVYTVIGNTNNLKTTFLRWGMMVISSYFEREQLIDHLLDRLFPLRLPFVQWLLRVSVTSSLLASLFTNDVTCILLTPLLLKKWIEQKRDVRELKTLLLAIATQANIGSTLTIFGNPQMALIASKSNAFANQHSRLELKTCVIYLWLPVFVVSLLNFAFLLLHHQFALRISNRSSSNLPKKELDSINQQHLSPLPNKTTRETSSLLNLEQAVSIKPQNDYQPSNSRLFKSILFIVIIIIIALLFASNEKVRFDIGLIPVGAAIVLFLADAFVNHRSPTVILQRIDWNILILFFGIFVWLDGLNSTGIPSRIWAALNLDTASFQHIPSLFLLYAFILIGSNIFSNVPLTILILEQIQPDGNHLNLVLYLAFLTTVAGNLTLFGSVANLIVAQKALTSSLQYKFDFWTYLKYGFVTTLILSLIGLFIIYGLVEAIN